MDNIKLSVIVPVYNVPEELLLKCVDSLQNQSLKELEIILVDDGTYNTSGIICDKLAKSDKRIKVIHQENKGLCGARNSGVIYAKGEWISFVDGDDWINKDAYKIIYNACNSKNVDIGVFGYIKDYPSYSVPSRLDDYFENGKIYSTKEDINYLKRMVLNYKANFSSVVTKFIKKDFLIKNNLLHDETLKQGAEGIEFNIRLFNCANRVLFINENYYHYIFNSNSITNIHNEKNHEMVLNCFKKIKREIDMDDKSIKKMFYNRLKYVVLTTAISGYFSESNNEEYFIQKRKFNKYLENDLVNESLHEYNDFGLGFSRTITLWLIRLRIFCLVKFIAKIRAKQKR